MTVAQIDSDHPPVLNWIIAGVVNADINRRSLNQRRGIRDALVMFGQATGCATADVRQGEEPRAPDPTFCRRIGRAEDDSVSTANASITRAGLDTALPEGPVAALPAGA